MLVSTTPKKRAKPKTHLSLNKKASDCQLHLAGGGFCVTGENSMHIILCNSLCQDRTFIKASCWGRSMLWFCLSESFLPEPRTRLHCVSKKGRRRQVTQWVNCLFFFRCGHAPWATWMQPLCCTSGTAEPSLFLTPLGDCHWPSPGLGAT